MTIATKLYAIFALLATVTVVIAALAAFNARKHAALTDEYETAFKGMQNVERIGGLVYAVEMETRGLYLAADVAAARGPMMAVIRLTDRIGGVLKEWESIVGPAEAKRFNLIAISIKELQAFHRQLVERTQSSGPAAARAFGDTAANRDAHTTLIEEIEGFREIYSHRAKYAYAEIDRGIALMAWLMPVLGALALLLAGIGAFIIRQAVVRPLAEITRVTEQVAEGAAIPVPHGARRDEIGALARSIAVFQHAMRHNEELNKMVVRDAEGRQQRQEQVLAEIDRFSREVETTVGELGTICNQMLAASTQLSQAADQARSRSEGATSASTEASSNVRDIASAAEELAASVMEIDRQVGQSNVIAEKAVTEAERTNAAVRELDEAARRIGDVVRLITDIAEQTNLLALNATIEAARAGEAGRGFAVVAGEVKALAGQTAKATEDIAAQITGMQQATARSIAAIGAIENTIRDIGAISGAIAAAVTEQGAATQEIARSVEVAAKRTNDTVDEIGRVSQATGTTGESVTMVKSVADDLDAVASRIRSQVDAFFQRLKAA